MLPSHTASAGAVRATVPRSRSCGTAMPSERQNMDVHAPAAHSTVDARMRPCSVTTAETRPAVVSIPRTAQEVRIVAPSRAAARANAGAALCGSARPSLAVYRAPRQHAAAPRTRRCNSFPSISRAPMS